MLGTELLLDKAWHLIGYLEKLHILGRKFSPLLFAGAFTGALKALLDPELSDGQLLLFP